MSLKISTHVRSKLKTKHSVNEEEIVQCFASREKGFLLDKREQHNSNPPTQWFVAETDYGKKLKIVFISDPNNNDIHIKTAYLANAEEIRIYEKFATTI